MAVRSLVLIILMTSCGNDSRAQVIELRTSLGYDFYQKRAQQQYLPHVWMEATYGQRMNIGFLGFINRDRIVNEWPGEGKYKQIRNEGGYGMVLRYSGYKKGARWYPSFSLAGGWVHQEWLVQSDNPFLLNAVKPREEYKTGFIQLAFSANYIFHKYWFATGTYGVGENMIRLGIGYELAGL